MLCWISKKKLYEFAAGELSVPVSQKIEKHLQGCPKCRSYVSGLQQISDIYEPDRQQPFLSEVFWRKFDERLDLNLAQQNTSRLKQAWSKVSFLPRTLPRVTFSAALALCLIVLYVSFFSAHNNRLTALPDAELIETALLIEDEAELNLNGDEDAYVEEILLQIELNEA